VIDIFSAYIYWGPKSVYMDVHFIAKIISAIMSLNKFSRPLTFFLTLDIPKI
jgi:hypothetical protein